MEVLIYTVVVWIAHMREKPNIIRCMVNFFSGKNLELQVSSPNLKKPKKAKVIVAQIMIESECVVEEIAKRA